MIKNLYGNSQWVTVGQYNTTMPYLNTNLNTTQPMTGMIRMNSSMNRTEVYDGQTWVAVGSDAHVDLSEQAKQALAWAYDKMGEEVKLLELLERHPGLKDLHDKFQVMKVLCQQEEKEKEK